MLTHLLRHSRGFRCKPTFGDRAHALEYAGVPGGGAEPGCRFGCIMMFDLCPAAFIFFFCGIAAVYLLFASLYIEQQFLRYSKLKKERNAEGCDCAVCSAVI